MRSLVSATFAIAVLSGCLASVPLQGDRISAALVGRSVVYDPPQPGLPSERETWRADGTRSAQQRGIFHRDWLEPYEGVWWIDGNLYCAARERRENESRWLCYSVMIDGDRISFAPYRRVLAFVPDMRLPRHGRFVD